MKAAEYEEYVDSMCKPYVTREYCVIALNEEAGEVAGWWKKAILRGDDRYTREDLLSELGDVLFYMTKMSSLHGWSLSDVMEYNVIKLNRRNS